MTWAKRFYRDLPFFLVGVFCCHTCYLKNEKIKRSHRPEQHTYLWTNYLRNSKQLSDSFLWMWTLFSAGSVVQSECSNRAGLVQFGIVVHFAEGEFVKITIRVSSASHHTQTEFQ